LAAVLVLLYEKEDELRVLTTRSKFPRVYPGRTALPGGKAEDTDRRRSHPYSPHEEVGLGHNSPHIHTRCTLPPFPSRTQLIVTPVVVFFTNPTILCTLKPGVDDIFNHPLEAILNPSLSAKEPLVPKGNEDWPYPRVPRETSTIKLSRSTRQCVLYRYHRFRSCASPVNGLTVDIFVRAAVVKTYQVAVADSSL
ncbi:hypothetical protein HD554DRAFT_2022332, partial [Boletus coccyginus]